MEIADLLALRSVIAQLRASNKKQALQEIAKRAAPEASEMARSFVLAPLDEEQESEPAADEAAAPTEGAPVVIAEMSAELPHLTVGEAVMRMDLADVPALLFRNRSHGELILVYRRGDGNIGWIDPGAVARPGPVSSRQSDRGR